MFNSMALEKICEYASDVGVPKDWEEMIGWVIKFILRWWDEPVLRTIQKGMRELRQNGTPIRWGTLELYKEGQYQIVKEVGRSVYSVRRSITRLNKIGKVNFILTPL